MSSSCSSSSWTLPTCVVYAEDYDSDGVERGKGEVICCYCPKKTLWNNRESIEDHVKTNTHEKNKGARRRMLIKNFDFNFSSLLVSFFLFLFIFFSFAVFKLLFFLQPPSSGFSKPALKCLVF